MTTNGRWQTTAVLGLAFVTAWAGQARADFVFGTPVNLGPRVNSNDHDYDPAISADGLELYFQSDRAGGYGANDLYVAKRATIDDAWYDVQNLGPTINTAAAESGPSLSSDGLTLYFNSDRPGGLGGHDLYMTTRASPSDPWGQPVNLGPVVNRTFSEINPNISSDGLSLYFSDVEGDTVAPRPGGRGNTDVWVSTRTSLADPWGPPVNLGTPVNNGWSNGSPEISSDGLLLFTNLYRGDQTFFDICVSVRKTVQEPWGAPMNLGAPINTNNWEGNAELSADGRTLYFVACCRPGGFGTTDIWQVSVNPIVDFNGDGKVDETDVQIMTKSLGTDDPLCDIGPTPFGDGIVDLKDMAVLTQCAATATSDPTLIACWTFDEAEGVVACDGAGTCDGTLMGGALWQSEAGVAGGAVLLDGVDDYVTANCPYTATTGPLSVIAWVKGGKPGQTILSQQGVFNWLAVDAATGTLVANLRSGGRLTSTLSSQAVIIDGNWHRIALTWDGVARNLYVDGEVVATDTQDSLKRTFNGLYIGGAQDLAPGTFWSGMVDDVRIYDRIVKP